MTKTAVKIGTKPKARKCRHPGRIFGKCKNCPRRG
jgi:hypothetical protein